MKNATAGPVKQTPERIIQLLSSILYLLYNIKYLSLQTDTQQPFVKTPGKSRPHPPRKYLQKCSSSCVPVSIIGKNHRVKIGHVYDKH